jgi:hypothetical protein
MHLNFGPSQRYLPLDAAVRLLYVKTHFNHVFSGLKKVQQQVSDLQ